MPNVAKTSPVVYRNSSQASIKALCRVVPGREERGRFLLILTRHARAYDLFNVRLA